MLPSGALKIIDRKKNLLKLSHGEYVAVEKVENQFKKSSLVDQIWVHGNSEKSALVAVVVPDAASLTSWAKEQGKSTALQVRCRSVRAALVCTVASHCATTCAGYAAPAVVVHAAAVQ